MTMLKKLLAALLAAIMLAGLVSLAQASAPAATQIPQATESAPAPAASAAESQVAQPSAAASAAAEAVLATVDGQPIYKSEADALLPALLQYEHITDPADYAYAVDFLIRQRVLDKKIAEMKFNVFTDAEKAEFEKQVQAEYDQAVQQYVSANLADDTPAAREELAKKAQEIFAANGYSKEIALENVMKRSSIAKMSTYLVGDYTPTQEEIDKVFTTYGESYKQNFENNIGEYEYATQYQGQKSWYTPEGYRGVIHILLTPDQALLDELSALQMSFEETQNAQNAEKTVAAVTPDASQPTKAPATQEMVDAVKQKILDAVKADTDKIYARLAAGEAFEDLIKEYGKDPGMADANNLKNGYPVHRQSVLLDPAFVKAAFSDKMQKPGDVSDPVVGMYGVHILKYLRDIPAGLQMTDEIKQQITQYLKSVKENEAYTTAYEGWKAAYQITYNAPAIQQATDEAKALLSQQNGPMPVQPAASQEPEAAADATPQATAAPEASPAAPSAAPGN